jgi:hypothetical protein
MTKKKIEEKARRDKMIMVRLRRSERARIAAAAKTRGLGMAALVRMALLAWLDQQKA